MTDLSATDIGQIVTFLAPGFLAQWAYRLRFPTRDRPGGELLIVSTVLSLPFVVLANNLAPTSERGDPLSICYVVWLLLPPLLIGLGAAQLRDHDIVRALLAGLGVSHQPDASIWQRTFGHLRQGSWVTVYLKSGEEVGGQPRSFPAAAEDGVKEIYLRNPRWCDRETGDFAPAESAGIIVRLDEVEAIALSEDPT